MTPAPYHCFISDESSTDESDGVNVVLMPILWMQERQEKAITEYYLAEAVFITW